MAAAPQGIQPGTPPQDLPYLDDFYVPAYRVLLKGQNIPSLSQDIQSVTFRDSLTDVDSVELVVNNWNPGDPVDGRAVAGTFRYSDGHVFDPWQQIEVWMGYYRNGADNLQKMITGEIVTMSPNFPASGGSTLTVRALNLLHQFRTQQKTKQFKQATDSEIAKQIVDDINNDIKKKMTHIQIQMLKKEVEDNKIKNDEQIRTYLEMHNQFPIVFLMQRARDTGYDITIEDVVDQSSDMRTITFHYRSSASVLRPTYVLEWGKSLISFQPSLQTAKQVASVTVRGWNVQTKQPISKTATRADLVKKGEKLVAPEDLGVTENQLSQKLEIVVDRGFKDPTEAQTVAEKTLRQLAQGLVEAKGKTIGLPDLRAGSKVNIYMHPLDAATSSGSSGQSLDRFSGTYLVTETTHTMSESGYTTDFTARMEAKVRN
jgi:phage protein D